MKNIVHKISVVSLALFLAFGCNSFLEEDPRGLLSPDNFYNSDAEANAAVNGIYATFMFNVNLYNVVGLSKFYEFGTDLINPNRYGGEAADNSLYNITEGNNKSSDSWRSLYEIGQDCNI